MYDRTTVQPYDLTTVQSATFNMRVQLYREHANATALQGRIQEFLKGGFYTIVVTFNANGVEGE